MMQGPFAIPTECGHVDVRETMENVLRQEALQVPSHTHTHTHAHTRTRASESSRTRLEGLGGQPEGPVDLERRPPLPARREKFIS